MKILSLKLVEGSPEPLVHSLSCTSYINSSPSLAAAVICTSPGISLQLCTNSSRFQKTLWLRTVPFGDIGLLLLGLVSLTGCTTERMSDVSFLLLLPASGLLPSQLLYLLKWTGKMQILLHLCWISLPP